MKLIRFLAGGMLALALVAAALGVSFFMSGEAASRPAKTFEDYMRDAAVYKDEKSYYKAIVSYERALEEQENNVDALLGLAETYGSKSDFAKELEIRQKIAEIQPDNIDNRIRVIEIMIRNKDFEGAKKETETVLSQYESEELSAMYEMMNVKAPEFTLSSGEYDEYQLLDIVPHQDNAVVRYTMDGSEPGMESAIWTDQLVISYPETEIRAIAYSPLGFPSEVTDLNLKITKPAEAVVSGRSYDNGSYMLRYLVDKSYDQEVYNYELAQIRTIYCIGQYNMTATAPTAEFYEDHYTYHNYEYDSYGNISLSFVQYTPFLKTLVFSFHEDSDLEPRSSLKYLENLSAYHCGIDDLSPLEDCKALRKLALGWNDISDISPLASLTSLESLGLWNNSIEDISPVKGLHNLTYLDFANNEVSNIDAVSELTELAEVWINGNKIKDISPLDHCEKIGVFMQAGNPIEEYGSVRDRAAKFYKTDLKQ